MGRRIISISPQTETVRINFPFTRYASRVLSSNRTPCQNPKPTWVIVQTLPRRPRTIFSFYVVMTGRSMSCNTGNRDANAMSVEIIGEIPINSLHERIASLRGTLFLPFVLIGLGYCVACIVRFISFTKSVNISLVIRPGISAPWTTVEYSPAFPFSYVVSVMEMDSSQANQTLC